MRQIVLDTETTGIGAEHRIIEVGCVELIDRKLTGNNFHTYLNPERDIDAGALKVHGLNNNFLKDKPLFADIVEEFWHFVAGALLIIHNAPFDLGFLNAELDRINWPKRMLDHCKVLDTLVMAREKHPGQRNNLDALCKRYAINNTKRQLHGALLDAEILAQVYLAMTGGQISLSFEENIRATSEVKKQQIAKKLPNNSPIVYANAAEIASHNEFLAYIKEQSGIDIHQQD